ncbi:MAG: hypothetical protein CMQ02_09705 [Gammaproteobacteria bacterium]|nr:hypothetical protein [Gammaproteobacteria bacterium]BAR30960.1 hypothetical protein [uncultured Mediterranean phage uvMED]
MASAAVVQQRVKDYLYGSDYIKRPFTDFLNQDGNVSATDTVITVSNISNWGVGDIVEFNTGEQAYIKNVSVDNNRFTVARAWNGTTAATVTDLTAIEKNPKFTLSKIDNAVAAIIEELYPEVYVFSTGSATANKDSYYYTTADTGLKEILSVYYPRSGSLGSDEPWVINTWKMTKHMHTSGFANGIGITMWDYGELSHGDTFYYTFKKKVAATTDLLDRQVELVVLGAVFKLMGSTVPSSTFDSKDGRQVTQPGQESSDSRWFLSEYMRSRKEENMRLKEEERFVLTSRQTRRQRSYRD